MTFQPFILAVLSALVALFGVALGVYLAATGNNPGAAKVLIFAAVLSGFLYGESEK